MAIEDFIEVLPERMEAEIEGDGRISLEKIAGGREFRLTLSLRYNTSSRTLSRQFGVILAYFMLYKSGEYEGIEMQVYGEPAKNSQRITSAVSAIRFCIEDNPRQPKIIMTQEIGWKLVTERKQLCYGGLTYIPETREVINGERHKRLTMLQAKLLEYFLVNPNTAIPYAELGSAVWEHASTSQITIMSTVGALRDKIQISRRPQLIRNIKGYGYIAFGRSGTQQ